MTREIITGPIHEFFVNTYTDTKWAMLIVVVMVGIMEGFLIYHTIRSKNDRDELIKEGKDTTKKTIEFWVLLAFSILFGLVWFWALYRSYKALSILSELESHAVWGLEHLNEIDQDMVKKFFNMTSST